MTDDASTVDRLFAPIRDRPQPVLLALGFMTVIALVVSPVLPVTAGTVAAVQLAVVGLVALGVAETVFG